MCGFFTIVSQNQDKIKNLDTRKILDSLERRGPDGEGEHKEDQYLSLHKRLSIVDLSDNGLQPMVCNDNRYVIAYNGEVYNWRDIRKQLKFQNWKSQTDTETVLHAYKERGVKCLDLLNGFFAFSIWDKETKTLFVARDRAGIKPFYFYRDGTSYLCASEAKAILAAGIPNEPDMHTISDYLRWGVVDHSDKSFFKNIHVLPPGTYCLIKPENMSVEFHRYWNIFEQCKDQPLLGQEEAREQFEALLLDSIDQQVLADVPVGTSLSGGIDSSVLTALTTERLGADKVKCFTYCFEGGGGEEILAENTANILGAEHIRCYLKAGEIPEYIKEVLYYQESPMTSTRVMGHHRMFEEARKRGVLVLLEGSGGDEMAAGYEYYYLPHIMDMLKNSSTVDAMQELSIFMDRFNVPKEKRMERLLDCLKTVLQPGVSTQDGVSFVCPPCLNDGYFESYDAPDFEGYFPDWLRKLQWIDFAHVVLPKALRYTDRASMASSCESRVPILDHRLVELSFRTQPDARMRNGHQRIFMRAAAERLLPDSILHRPKQTIVDPQRTWLKKELRDWVFDLFNSQTARNIGFLNLEKIKEEYEIYLNTDNPRTSAHIFQYINIINWYDVFAQQS